MTFSNIKTNNSDQVNKEPKVHKISCEILPELASPSHELANASIQVYRPSPKDVFTIVGDSITVACLVNKLPASGGNKFGEEEFYPIAQALQKRLKDNLRPIRFHLTLDSQGGFFLMPQKLPFLNGSTDPWTESMEAVVEAGKEGWIKRESDRVNRCYRALSISSSIPITRVFPDIGEVFDRTMADNIIANANHPILGELGLQELIEDSSEQGGDL